MSWSGSERGGPRRAARLFAVVLMNVWVSVSISSAPVLAESAPSTALAHAYDLAYNLDHDEAMATLEAILQEYPEQPAPHRGIAALTWLRMLFLRGSILVDAQMTSSVRSSGPTLKPPEELAKRFRRHIDRAIELSEAAIEHSPDDPDAYFELGASVALKASYKASIEGEPLRALRDAKRAYDAHERVLELDPTRKDAGLTLGIYRYLVSLLPRPIRMMAYLVGFDGGREEALRLIEEAAAYPGESEAEARFALVLLYNRERRYPEAQHVLRQLKQAFPRNRLIWLESASTWLRDDHAYRASRELERGLAKLADDDRTRMQAEEEMWRLKRASVNVALGQVDEARADLEHIVEADAQVWVHGHAHLEQGKIADLNQDRRSAKQEYDQARSLCRKANDRRCARAAETLSKYGYPLR